MDKLNMHTKNIPYENISYIEERFPACVVESKSEEGVISKHIDFDILRQELSENIIEGQQERYQLNWPGKREALLTANAPIAKTLRPFRKESVDFDNTENLFVEGDNLDALKLLQETYLGKVKIIYIDPPYNTGKDFIYSDIFVENANEYLLKTNQKSKEGAKLSANIESNGRIHSDWLSMMFSRLKLARNLLKKDGLIFISIDDCEQSNLKKICDEVFGEKNFVEQFIARSNPRGNQAKKNTASEHEYIICYAKEISSINPIGFDKEVKNFKLSDKRGEFREIGLRKRGAGARKEDAPNQHFPIYYSSKKEAITTKKPKGKSIKIIPKLSDGSDGRWRWSKKSVEERKEELLVRKVNRKGSTAYDVFQKDYFDTDKKSKIKSIIYEKEINYENGTEEQKDLFGGLKLFDYPKPVYLIKHFLSGINDKDCLVVDFFAGSATTAHAVMQLNAEDGGSRKFINIQLPEKCSKDSEAFKAGYKTVAEISKERIRLVGKKILKANQESKENKKIDIGFRVLKVDSSNMEDVYYTPDAVEQGKLNLQTENIKSDRSAEDLLFQVLLDWGIDLTLPIVKDKISGMDIFFVDKNALAACFESDGKVTEDFCKKACRMSTARVVFRDSGFKDDSVKINVEQIFKLKSPHTDVKAI